MEINANPSLNYFNESSNNGEVQQKLSEIDQFVKTQLVRNTIKLLSSAPLFSSKTNVNKTNAYKPVPVSSLGFLKQIRGSQTENDCLEELHVYSKAIKIFNYLQGDKIQNYLSIHQFAQLAKLIKINRQQTDLIFKAAVGKGQKTMDLNCFFLTLEEVSATIYSDKTTIEGLAELVDNCVA